MDGNEKSKDILYKGRWQLLSDKHVSDTRASRKKQKERESVRECEQGVCR